LWDHPVFFTQAGGNLAVNEHKKEDCEMTSQFHSPFYCQERTGQGIIFLSYGTGRGQSSAGRPEDVRFPEWKPVPVPFQQ
jgi:hypothetical protein